MVLAGSGRQDEIGETTREGSDLRIEEGVGGEVVAEMNENEDIGEEVVGHESSVHSDSSIPALVSAPVSCLTTCQEPASDSPRGNNDLVLISSENLQNDGNRSDTESVNYSQASTTDIACVGKTSYSSSEKTTTSVSTSISNESTTALTLSSLCSTLSSPKSGRDTDRSSNSQKLSRDNSASDTPFSQALSLSCSVQNRTLEEEIFGAGNSFQLASTPTDNTQIEFSEPLLVLEQSDDEELEIPPSPDTKTKIASVSFEEELTSVKNDDEKENCIATSVKEIIRNILPTIVDNVKNEEKNTTNEFIHNPPLNTLPIKFSCLFRQPSIQTDDEHQSSITTDTSSDISLTQVGSDSIRVIAETTDEENKDDSPDQIKLGRSENEKGSLRNEDLALSIINKDSQDLQIPNQCTTVAIGPRRESDLFAPLRLPDLNFQRVMQDIAGPSGVSKRYIPYGDSDSDSDYVRTDDAKQISRQIMKRQSPYFSVKGKGRGKRSKIPADCAQSPLPGTHDVIVLPFPTTSNETIEQYSKMEVADDREVLEKSVDCECGNICQADDFSRERFDGDCVLLSSMLDEMCSSIAAKESRNNSDQPSTVIKDKNNFRHDENLIPMTDVAESFKLNTSKTEDQQNDEEISDLCGESSQLGRSKSDNPVSCQTLVRTCLFSKSSSVDGTCVPRTPHRLIKQKSKQVTADRHDGNGEISNKSIIERVTSPLNRSNLKFDMDPNATITRKVTTTIITKRIVEEEIICGGVVVQRTVDEIEDEPMIEIESDIDGTRSYSSMMVDPDSPAYESNRSTNSSVKSKKKWSALRLDGERKSKLKSCSSTNDLTIHMDDDDDKFSPISKPFTLKRAQSSSSRSSSISDDVTTEDKNCFKSVSSATVTNDDQDTDPKTIRVGKRVMARWTDGYLYPGRICQQDDDGRWIVAYDDGNVRPALGGIVAVDILPVGMSVYAQPEDSVYFESGIITGHSHSGNKLKYTIALDSGETKIVSRSAVTMTVDQASCLFKDSSQNNIVAPGINLGNIIEGKRRHKSISTMHSPLWTKTPRKRKNIRPEKEGNSSSKKRKIESPDENSPKSKRRRENTPVRKLEQNDSCETPKSHKNFIDKVRERFAAVKRASTESDCGQVPPLGSTIYTGKKFLLTEASVNNESSSLSSHDSSPPSPQEAKIPFSKNHLSKQIRAGGGSIIEEVPQDETDDVFLISNNFTRTSKYIKSIALGIPCVSYQWIVDSSRDNVLLPYDSYLLPTGLSLLTNDVVEWHGQRKVLSGCRFAVFLPKTDSESDIASFWTSVLQVAGAEIVASNLADIQGGGQIDGALTDKHCSAVVMRKLNKLGIKMLTSDWVIQCLIHGRQLSYSAHDQFTLK